MLKRLEIAIISLSIHQKHLSSAKNLLGTLNDGPFLFGVFIDRRADTLARQKALINAYEDGVTA